MSEYGTFGWFELMTTDPEAAKAFYTKVIGWEIRNWPMAEGGDYAMFAAASGPMGGCMELPEEAAKMGAPPHWAGYVYVPDAAATVAKVAALGGQVHVPPTPIPNVGIFAVFADPQGATISILQPERLSEDPPATGPGQMGWHELATTDVAGARAFYSEVFGWKETRVMDMGGGMMYHLFGKGEDAFGGMFTKPAEMPGPSMWMYYIRVGSVDAALRTAGELGATLLMGPHEVPGGDIIAQFFDPQGAFFAIVGGK